MTPSDWIALGALIISIAAFVLSIVLALNSNRISKVELEQAFLSHINEARKSYSSLAEKIADLNIEDDEKKKTLLFFLDERLEEYLNSLDYACSKYLSKVLDKESFENNFKRLIQEANDNNSMFRNVLNGDKNRFTSLKKVYHEFFTQAIES